MVSEDGRFISSRRVEGFEKVCDLMEVNKKEWNHAIMEEHFNEKDRGVILAIPLCEAKRCDEHFPA